VSASAGTGQDPSGVRWAALSGSVVRALPFMCFLALVACLWVPTRMATPALIEEPGLYLLADQGISLVPAGSFNEAHRLRPFDGVVFALGHRLSADSFRGLSALLIAIFVAKGLVAFALFQRLLPGQKGLSLLAAGLAVVYPADSGLMLLRFAHVHLALTCGLLAVLLLLLLAERWRLWLVPLMWAAALFSVGTYEASAPLLVAAPALLLLPTQTRPPRFRRLCLAWYAPIAGFVAWALVSSVGKQSDVAQQDQLIRSLSWSDAIHHGLPALVRGYRWHFWDAWSDALTSVYRHPSALAAGLVVGAVFFVVAWRAETDDPGVRRRDLAIACFVGLVALGLGYVAYAMLPSHRDLTDRLQTAAPGAALAVSALVALVFARRVVVLAVVSCLLALAAASALQQNRAWVDVKTTQDHLVSQLVQIAPAFTRSDTAVIVVDDTGSLATDYSFQYPEVLANRVRQLYEAPGVEVVLCYPGHTFPWGCTLGPDGAHVTYAGIPQGPTFRYPRTVVVEYDLDGRLHLLHDLRALTSTGKEPAGYAPEALIAAGSPAPARAATELSPWPPTSELPPTLRARDHVSFSFGGGIAGPGWGGAESDPRGRSYQWSVDNVASLTTSLSPDRDYVLRLTVLQTFVPDLVRSLELAVNHVLLRRRTVRAPDGTYCVLATIPRAVLARTRFFDRIDVIVPHLAGPRSATNVGLGVAADELDVTALGPNASSANNGCGRGT
jgi:hypothetical protein